MYTQCPECRTIFEIDEEALQASFGIVHCGHCAKRFDALRSLSNTLPLEPDAGFPALPDEPRIPTLTAEVSAAVVAAAANKYRRQGAQADSAPDAGNPDPDALLTAAADDDDWFAELQADLAAELDPVAPGDPDGERLAPADAPDAIPMPIAEPEAEAPMTTGTTAAAEPASAPDAPAPDTPIEAPHADAPPVAPLDPTVDAAEPVATAGAGATASIDPAAGLLAMAEAEPSTAVPEPAPPGSTPSIEPNAATTNAAPAPDAEAAPEPAAEAMPASDVDTSPEAPPRPPAASTEPAAAPVPDPESLHGNVHMYVRPLGPRRPRAALAWPLGCVALVLLLAAQVTWAERTALYLNPSTHAWMAQVCATLGCRLPPIHDPARLALVSRDIRPDPRHPGALAITATLHNAAGFREAWPVVSVVLTDIDNQPVAMRRFRPAEYMPDRARRNAGIPPGATVAVAFEVADPGPQARGFQFAFE